ncbi:RNA-binding S4 domain-containing protein [Lysinibacillus sp. TE18511]
MYKTLHKYHPKIDVEFVTLGQLLKMTDAISSGGMAKWFLHGNDVYVNGEVAAVVYDKQNILSFHTSL